MGYDYEDQGPKLRKTFKGHRRERSVFDRSVRNQSEAWLDELHDNQDICRDTHMRATAHENRLLVEEGIVGARGLEMIDQKPPEDKSLRGRLHQLLSGKYSTYFDSAIGIVIFMNWDYRNRNGSLE